MDKQAKKEHAATPVMGMPPGPPATERVWSVGTGSQAYQPRVLMSVGELEIALTAAGAADLVVALDGLEYHCALAMPDYPKLGRGTCTWFKAKKK